MNDALNGRTVHIWRGVNRKDDTAKLADAIASLGVLINFDGRFAQLEDGRLALVNLAAFRTFIDEHIAGVRVICRDGVWQRQYFSFGFPPPPRRDPTKPALDDDLYPEPDSNVLDDLYSRELAYRLPKVAA